MAKIIRFVSVLLALVAATSMGGCPQGAGNSGNQNTNVNGGGSGGDSSGNSNEGNANSNTANGNENTGNSNERSDDTSDDGGGGFFLRFVAVSESSAILTLTGAFGNEPGEVWVNGSARPLAGGGWTAGQVEVSINPQDLGEVYVKAGDRTTNSRWITGWDFTIRRTYQLFQRSLCPTCQAQMTYRFRMRGDVAAVDNGSGNITPGAAANYGVRGATFSIDSVTGSWLSDFDNQQRVWSLVQTAPVYYIAGDAGQFIGGAGEWFSTFAGVDPGNSRAVVAVSIDTDGYRVTNLDTGETTVDHISDFGVYQNLAHPGTIVMPLSPSLNIPAGSTSPDSNGSYWEWDAAPVQSPPPANP